MHKNLIDDGFRADLVETARFDGIFEIPVIKKPDKIIITDGMVPFRLIITNIPRDVLTVFSLDTYLSFSDNDNMTQVRNYI